jgi:hypothetical protein
MKRLLSCVPETAAGQSKPAGEITDKKGFAARWGFSGRMVDNFLAAGLPHLAVGKRRVRIIIAEADAWMMERFGTRRSAAKQSAPQKESAAL